MKKAIIVICLLLVFSSVFATTSLAAPGLNDLFNYYFLQYTSGKMASPPSDIIGDSTLNEKIDANDALLALVFSVSSKAFLNYHAGQENTLVLMEIVCCQFYSNSYYDDLNKSNWGTIHTIGHIYESNPLYLCYTHRAYFLSDVSNDCTVNAEDALLILQYAVGKIDAFPRTDYTGKDDFQYMVWPANWYPTMYCDLREYRGEDAYAAISDDFPDIPPMKTE